MTTLYDWMADHGYMDSGCDCYDENDEFSLLCIIPVSEEDNAYDRVVNWILKQVAFVHAGEIPAYDLVGDFEGFVREHLKEFSEFTKRNRESYIMSDMDDEDNVYKGLCTIRTLCAGGYGEGDYEDFERIFGIRGEKA